MEASVSDVTRQMKSGGFDALKPGEFNIVLGVELARALQVTVGEQVMLAMAQGESAASGATTGAAAGALSGALPRTRPFRVVGIFEAGHNEFDSTLAFVHLADAEQLLHTQGPSGIRLRLRDLHQAPQVSLELKRSMPGDFYIRNWAQVNSTWFAAVQSQKRMMFIILAMIIAVAAFNLVSTLVMTVTDKQADIAILRTLGASPRSVMKIFVIQGALTGIIGTVAGVGLGVLVSLNIDVIVPAIEHLLGIKFLSKDIYFISTVPSDLRWADVLRIGGVAMLLAFAATLYPSWWAARVNPAQALRYE
jgi:lipoprotein-releasing system permease protein